MPARCVAANCGNRKDKKRNISMHLIPFYGDTRPEGKKRRKRWVDWVKMKRAKWEPSQHSHLCSDHFQQQDFMLQLGNEGELSNRWLQRDDLGVCVFPSVHSGAEREKPLSARDKRMTMKAAMSSHRTGSDTIDEPRKKRRKKQARLTGTATATCSNPAANTSSPPEDAQPAEVEPPAIEPEEVEHSLIEPAEVELTEFSSIGETSTGSIAKGSTSARSIAEGSTSDKAVVVETDAPSPGNVEPAGSESKCSNCSVLENQNRILQNKIITLKGHFSRQKNENRKNRRRSKTNIVPAVQESGNQESDCDNKTMTTAEEELEDVKEEEEEEEDEDEKEDEEEDEKEDEDEEVYEVETDETETTETESDEDDSKKSSRLQLKGSNLRSEPKHIVFLTKLLLLFRFCTVCKADNPLVEARENGSEVIVKTTCINQKCQKEQTWYSQPLLPNSKIPAGNFLLCMSTLLSGGSATKVFQVFRHMGLGCVSINTFFKYQRTKLFPSIYLYWQRYQSQMLAKLKAIQDGITIAGDGRHDSMGHSAKFCAYTIFCCTVPMIIHFSLVQRNEAGSSTGMEFMAFQQCMDFLLAYGLLISTFISDRHVSIASHMKKVLTNIVHYFDIWHLKKKIRKVLSKIAKLKDCEALSEWIKPCERHLHWSATSTFNGNGRVILAKFKAFLNHVINKHSGFSDPLFNKCAHGNIEPRKWLKSGTLVYEKLCEALSNNALVRGIKQASPLAQTSCLEGFHSVLNHFSPKMIAYSYVGMYCRHILAAVHFNFNLQREVKHRETDGVERVKVSYPKFKNGEATVRDVKVKPNFEYVEEIFQTFMNASKDELEDASTKLHEKTPAAMNTMLEKQPRAEALLKRDQRSKMVVKDVPPTTPVSQVPETTGQQPERREKTIRKCKECKQPLKGHKNVADCPRNKRQK